MNMSLRSTLLTSSLVVAPVAAAAEWEFSVYLGIQEAPHSTVSGNVDGVGDFDFGTGWEGRSFEAPPYYGLRVTHWLNDTVGYAIDFTHAKVYSEQDRIEAEGFTRLEFTDGLNHLTLNYMRRYPEAWGGFTPYWGAGGGLSIPHVDVSTATSRTFEYQITGPAVVWLAGATYPFNDSFSGFLEYKGSFSSNEADLDGGGTLETDIITNALNFGVSYSY